MQLILFTHHASFTLEASSSTVNYMLWFPWLRQLKMLGDVTMEGYLIDPTVTHCCARLNDAGTVCKSGFEPQPF
jgi:hypothetical protein